MSWEKGQCCPALTRVCPRTAVTGLKLLSWDGPQPQPGGRSLADQHLAHIVQRPPQDLILAL